jgi:hypothetical protein
MSKTAPKSKRRIAKASDIPVPAKRTPEAIGKFADWWEERGDEIDSKLWGQLSPEVEAQLRRSKP